jgi:hypothetical protein
MSSNYLNKKITLNGLKFSYGLYAHKDVSMNDYLHLITNTTFKLTDTVIFEINIFKCQRH